MHNLSFLSHDMHFKHLTEKNKGVVIAVEFNFFVPYFSDTYTIFLTISPTLFIAYYLLYFDAWPTFSVSYFLGSLKLFGHAPPV